MIRIAPGEPTAEQLKIVLSHPDASYEIVDGQIVESPEMSLLAQVVAQRMADAMSKRAKGLGLGLCARKRSSSLTRHAIFDAARTWRSYHSSDGQRSGRFPPRETATSCPTSPSGCSARMTWRGTFRGSSASISGQASAMSGWCSRATGKSRFITHRSRRRFSTWKIVPKPSQTRTTTVRDARPILIAQETEALIEPEKINAQAVALAEESGIVFLDEIDKIAGDEGGGRGPDVSRQGVQRDLLPIVEGTSVATKYGPVKTDHVLFVAAGAFHRSKPSDLMPELQGRFPIRVELQDLNRDDFARILREPRASLVKQYQALLGTEGLTVDFTPDSIEAMAEIAYSVNRSTQNIGARRLHTILERVVEDISFEASDRVDKAVVIDAAYVRSKLDPLTKDEDLSRFIL